MRHSCMHKKGRWRWVRVGLLVREELLQMEQQLWRSCPLSLHSPRTRAAVLRRRGDRRDAA